MTNNHVLEFARTCHETLVTGQDKRIKQAKDYLLDERKLTRQIIDFHQIGFCSKWEGTPLRSNQETVEVATCITSRSVPKATTSL